jgi:hypothetical protein
MGRVLNTFVAGDNILASEINTNFEKVNSKFGGDGSDGALNIASGTTTIDAGGENVFIKNYTSINIASGATLTISNPASEGTILILRSQEDATIEGKIELKGKGASAGTSGYAIMDDTNHRGAGGENGNSGSGGGAGGAGGAIYSNKFFYTTADDNLLFRNLSILTCGSGGGNGGDGYKDGGGTGGAGGSGGAGGGGLLIECGGSLDLSGEIDISGNNGANGDDAPAGVRQGGGGGGGGGASGMMIALYESLTANTATINAKGGSGGNGGAGNSNGTGGDANGGGGGAGGGSYTTAGKNGGNATLNGTATTDASGAGGGGGGKGLSTASSGGSGGSNGATDTNHYSVLANKFL